MYTLISALIFAFFAWHIYCDRRLYFLAWASRKWLPAEGVIISVEDSSFEIDSVSKYSTATSTRYYEYQLTICYDVGGTEHTTKIYSFGAHMDQPWSSHTVGRKIRVYYDPDEPGTAVVQRGLATSLVLNLVFALAGAAGVIYGFLKSI